MNQERDNQEAENQESHTDIETGSGEDGKDETWTAALQLGLFHSTDLGCHVLAGIHTAMIGIRPLGDKTVSVYSMQTELKLPYWFHFLSHAFRQGCLRLQQCNYRPVLN